VLLEEAREIVQRLLLPLPLDRFLDEILGRQFVFENGDAGRAWRTNLLGPDPEAVLLSAYTNLAPTLAHHTAHATEPPPRAESVADAAAFKTKVDEFHARGYTVRTEDIGGLSSELDHMIRAIEILLHQKVGVKVFWSRDDGTAPVHYDEHDLIVVQLRGRKRWFISTDRSDLPNSWKRMPGSFDFERYATFEVAPGDFIYMPRGTPHRVEALDDSLHLSIGFIPVTLRDALIACIDRLSDIHRPLREIAGERLGAQTRSNEFGRIPEQVREGAAALLGYCRSDEFIRDALQHRSSQAVAGLKKPPPPTQAFGPLTPEIRLRHNPLAACHVMGTSSEIVFAYPGGHHYLHRGAQESIVYIMRTPEFRLGDVPAGSDEVREALVERLLASRFLERLD
jgi:ribosomal protein L16 Arg81 hydroxylase